MSLGRYRQVLAAIRRRKYFDSRQQRSLVSWQVRNISTFIAGGYMVDGKKGNPALDMASNLAIDEIEKEQLAESQRESAAVPIEPKVGSYERLMGTVRNRS